LASITVTLMFTGDAVWLGAVHVVQLLIKDRARISYRLGD
jgi:hypothetical protein